MNLKDLFGGSKNNNKSAPKSNMTLIIIIVCICLCLCLTSIIGYFIYNSKKTKPAFSTEPTTEPTTIPTTLQISATGGILVTSGQYTYHVFTKNDNIIFNTSKNVEYLIIGGGGSGGNAHGGGGGSGGIKIGGMNVIASSYPVVVGNGGIQPIINSTIDCQGQDSSIFDNIALGGGYGGGASTGPASRGGSGGGGSGYYNDGNKSIKDGASPKDNQDKAGGSGGNGNQDQVAGGGGGGGSSGGNGENGLPNIGNSTAKGGKGGLGTNNYSEWLSAIKNNMPKEWIDATANGNIAAGGGGGSWATEVQFGGDGGGGNGGSWQGGSNDTKFNIDPTKGVSNTGSGGGGGGSNNRLGAAGGSGLVVVRYKN